MVSSASYFWFRLFRTRRIGAKRLVSVAKILNNQQIQPEHINLEEEKLSEIPELGEILKDKIKDSEEESIFQEFEALQNQGIKIIYPGADDYPQQLLEYADKFCISPVLFSQGKKSIISNDGIAIIGSRNSSSAGLKIAKEVAYQLSNQGNNVISGYAKGVDCESHLGALKAKGTTTMVLSYGIRELRIKKVFKCYDWSRDILAVSQFYPNAKWSARNAMTRNKLVCALSRAVIVIESGVERNEKGQMSGTFEAAKVALTMGLPLLVVSPNFYRDPPTGNQELINLGGREFYIFEDIDNLNQFIDQNKLIEKGKSKDKFPKQMSLPFLQ